MFEDDNTQQQPRSTSFESLDTLIFRWRNGTLGEILDDWRWIFSYSKRYKKAIAFYIVLGILSTTLGLVSSIAGKYLIDIITGYQVSKLWIMVLVMVGSSLFGVFSLVLAYHHVIRMKESGFAPLHRLRQNLYRRKAGEPLSLLRKHGPGVDAVNRIYNSGTEKFSPFRCYCFLSYRASIYRQAASAAVAPSPAAVVSCRTLLLRQSPATKTPGVFVVHCSSLSK